MQKTEAKKVINEEEFPSLIQDHRLKKKLEVQQKADEMFNNKIFGANILNQDMAGGLKRIKVKFPTIEPYLIEITLTILGDEDMSMALLRKAFAHQYVPENQSDKQVSMRSQRVEVVDGCSNFWT